jgi:hypothetical protein
VVETTALAAGPEPRQPVSSKTIPQPNSTGRR